MDTLKALVAHRREQSHVEVGAILCTVTFERSCSKRSWPPETARRRQSAGILFPPIRLPVQVAAIPRTSRHGQETSCPVTCNPATCLRLPSDKAGPHSGQSCEPVQGWIPPLVFQELSPLSLLTFLWTWQAHSNLLYYLLSTYLLIK